METSVIKVLNGKNTFVYQNTIIMVIFFILDNGLKAYNGHGKAFKLDTIDETLTTGKLAPKKTLKGTAVFASNDESVYDTSIVKLSDDCDSHDNK